jgi:hypothetical protein
MSARVAVNSHGQWIAYCQACNETASGTMRSVDLWADAHNSYQHGELNDHK